MTDTATANASGQSGQGTAGATAGAAKDGTSVDPFSGLVDPGSREWVGKNGIKDLSPASFEAVVKQARDAQTLIGKSIQVPADDAKPEDVDKYLSKATEKYRPKEAAGYEFALPADIPKEMPYDGDAANEFKGVAHELGLTAKQAQKAHDWFVNRQAGAFKTTTDGQVKRAADTTAALEKKWGNSESDGFKKQVDYAVQGVKGVGGDAALDDLRAANLLGPRDIILYPWLAEAFAILGEKHYAEDKLIDGSSSASDANNPFVTGNQTEQHQMIKHERPKAERMIAAAGKSLADFGLAKT